MNHHLRFALKMMHKRGLSPDELDNLDPDLFNALYIYDALIEPNGAKMEMLAHAKLCETILLSSGNLTKEGRKNLKITDFDYLDILGDDSLTSKEKAHKKKEIAEQNNSQSINKMGSLIKRMAKEGNNGKRK